jgi:hypothetical protein
MENDAKIFPAHYAWKVAEKGFQMACTVNKLAMINPCEIILANFACTLYSIKYGSFNQTYPVVYKYPALRKKSGLN